MKVFITASFKNGENKTEIEQLCTIVKNAEALGSVGTESVSDRKYDLVISNIPAKIGDCAITEEFIIKPYKLLNPNGEYWIVVVSALNHLIPKVCNTNKIKVKEVRKRHGHTVYRIIHP